MPFDAGGLQYSIEVGDFFSAQLERFNALVDQAKANFADLKRLGAQFKTQQAAAETTSTAGAKGSGGRRSRAPELDTEARALRAAKNELEARMVAMRKELELNRAGILSNQQLAASRRADTAARADQRRSDAAGAKQDVANRAKQIADLRTDISARASAAQQRVQEAAAEGKSEAAADAQRRARQTAALRGDIQARSDAARQRSLQIAAEARTEAAADAQRRAAELARLRATIEERARAQAASPEGLAQKRVAAVQQELAVNQRILELAKVKGAVPAGEVDRARDAVKRLNGELDETDTRGNRISFTFRRLFGILAAFAAARALARGISEGIKEAVLFNAEIETANLGVASLIVSVGDVRRPTGEAAQGAEALSIAMAEARRQTALLRVESQQTAAPLKEIIETFQIATAPGLQAGLNLDQIRRLTVQISQAAAAVGVPQQQLAEEIRSILAGTIQLRTTRIAAALGITNEDVRRAKELGNFANFLEQKFEGFTAAGTEALGTFDRILANLKKGLDIVLGTAGQDLFKELKDDLKSVSDSIVKIEGDQVIINPQAVEVVRGILDGLSQAVRIVFNLREGLDLSGAVVASRAIGDGLVATATIVRPLIAGFALGLRDAALIFSPVLSLLKGGGGFLGTVLGQLVRALGVLIAIRGVVSVVSALLGSIPATLVAIYARTVAWNAQLETAEGRALALKTSFNALKGALAAVAALGIVAGLEDISDSVHKILDLPPDAQVGILNTFRVLFIEITSDARKAFVNIAHEARNQLAAIIPTIGFETEAALQRKLDKISSDAADSLLAIRTQVAAGSEPEAGSLIDLLEGMPAIIGGSRRELEQQKSIVKDLTDAFRDAEAELHGTLSTLGAEGAALRIQQELVRANIELRKKGVELATQQTEADQRLASVLASQEGVRSRISILSQEDADKVRTKIALLRGVADDEQKIQDLKQLQAKQELDIAEARRRGDFGRADGLEKSKAALLLEIKGRQVEVDGLKSTLKTTAATQEAADKERELNDLAQKFVVLSGQEVVAREDSLEIQKEQAGLEDLIFKAVRARVRVIAVEEVVALRAANRETQAQLQADRELLASRRAMLSALSNEPLRQQLAVARGILNVEKVRLRNAIDIEEQTLRSLRAQRGDPQLKERQTAGEIAQLDDLIAQHQERQNLLLGRQRLLLDDIGRKVSAMEEASRSVAGMFDLGLKTALAQFVENAPDDFQVGLRLMGSALEGFVQIGRGAFRSIFDPNSNFSIRQAFGELLLDLGSDLAESGLRQVFAQIFEDIPGVGVSLIAPATSASSILAGGGIAAGNAMIAGATAAAAILAGGSAAATASIVPIGLIGFVNRGGPIGRARGSSFPEHAGQRARGFAFGRPPHIPASDTIPAWLTPGEWVVRAESVRRYGADTMDSINRGMVDPALLRGLTAPRSMRSRGTTSTSSVSSSPSTAIGAVGMARGGPVSRPREREGGFRAIGVVFDRQTSERIANNGEGATRRFLQEEGITGD